MTYSSVPNPPQRTPSPSTIHSPATTKSRSPPTQATTEELGRKQKSSPSALHRGQRTMTTTEPKMRNQKTLNAYIAEGKRISLDLLQRDPSAASPPERIDRNKIAPIDTKVMGTPNPSQPKSKLDRMDVYTDRQSRGSHPPPVPERQPDAKGADEIDAGE